MKRISNDEKEIIVNSLNLIIGDINALKEDIKQGVNLRNDIINILAKNGLEMNRSILKLSSE